ncbi:MAG: PD-(D/E)XK nuclease family protein, partial [Limisphaerales bacterium]
MPTRFLLGPAGSGKTFRCLAEIRAALQTSPDDATLILIAPKQATFQLERQLLADKNLAGYTRLQILSFERLADFILAELQKSPAKLLTEEGRVMVLRALLLQKRNDLKLFRASAQLPGFVQQLNLLLRELQRYHFSPQNLFSLAEKIGGANQLSAKLRDLALLLNGYLDWSKAHDLQDGGHLLDLAAVALQENSRADQSSNSKLKIQNSKLHLWLDGFAEMTPQETDLLAAIVPYCENATLAFCLENLPKENLSWLSIWSVVGQTFRQCHEKLAALPNQKIEVEVLSRDTVKNRFANNPILRHLEEFWSNPKSFTGDSKIENSLRLALCANPEAEAILAAREILRFVRGGGRYREIAVLLRDLNGYNDILRRVFSRYEIPFFLDRREPVAHHPLAELTRSALRMLASNWQHEDLFGALKTGLVNDNFTAIDQLENEALARGWKGNVWLQPLKNSDEKKPIEALEKLRKKIVFPFQQLARDLTINSSSSQKKVTGIQLAGGLRKFWDQLNIENKLEKWSATELSNAQIPNSIHATVWQQMNAWLDNLALAFSHEPLSLSEWLPILEAGLSSLSVGIIPPALDQVLIGAIDRSRNPDLKLTLILGLNESVFPAAPVSHNLLTEPDRAELEKQNIFLGPNTKQLLGRERFYGYIACTRSRDKLVLTCAQASPDGQTLNPSPFFSLMEQLFSQAEIENYSAEKNWSASEHASELVALLFQNRIQKPESRSQNLSALENLPVFLPLREQLENLSIVHPESLSPKLAEQLYGPVLKTSVTSLEQFAACPFKFFIHSGLSARERLQFELDVREQGSFQHAVLAEFHEQLQQENKQWRDLTSEKARKTIGDIAEKLSAGFRDGLFRADAQSGFTAKSLTESLQQFIAAIIGWMSQYDFNPHSVELAFGMDEKSLPAWELDLDERHKMAFRGKIDRIDICSLPDCDEALGVV